MRHPFFTLTDWNKPEANEIQPASISRMSTAAQSEAEITPSSLDPSCRHMPRYSDSSESFSSCTGKKPSSAASLATPVIALEKISEES